MALVARPALSFRLGEHDAPVGVVADAGRANAEFLVLGHQDRLAVAGRVHPARDDGWRLGGWMPSAGTLGDDLAHTVIRVGPGIDRMAVRSGLHDKQIVP